MSATGRERQPAPAAIEATLAAIKRRVRAREGLVLDGPDDPPAEARGALTEAMDAAHISAHTPILWDLPIVGRGIALTKRTVRLLLRWYIQPDRRSAERFQRRDRPRPGRTRRRE